MADEHDEPANRSKRWVWFVTLPVLYVLSVGPVIWIAALVSRWFPSAAGIQETAMFQTIYAPLRLAAHHSPWFSDFLFWYILLPLR